MSGLSCTFIGVDRDIGGPDKYSDPIWFRGAQYPSYEPPLPLRLRRRCSRVVVPSAQSGHPPSAPRHFDCDSYCPSRRQQRALVISNGNYRLATRILPSFYVTIIPTSTPFRHSSLTVFEREQAEAAAASVPTPISSSPLLHKTFDGSAMRMDGQVTPVEVVCCERVNRCLQQPLYIYIQGEVRDIFFPQCLSDFSIE